jgi:hypothetical protein
MSQGFSRPPTYDGGSEPSRRRNYSWEDMVFMRRGSDDRDHWGPRYDFDSDGNHARSNLSSTDGGSQLRIETQRGAQPQHCGQLFKRWQQGQQRRRPHVEVQRPQTKVGVGQREEVGQQVQE